MTHQHLVEVNKYEFSFSKIEEISNNTFVVNHWPLVYLLSNEGKKTAYIGETTDAFTRMSTHLKHNEKCQLTVVHLITSEKFNKSATLDIESSLIKYIAADGKFSLMNGNLGLVNHNYYQKDDLYLKIFESAWNKLRREGIVTHSLEYIDNSDLFKYSPYKTLSFDQRQGLLGIMYALLDTSIKNLIVQGGAGTGKSILAIFLFKLLHSNGSDINFKEFSSEESELQNLLIQLKARYPNPKMALVVPMTSFRNTLKKAFSNISGLSPSMVISPSELAKQRYNIVIVDESHRLRRRVNLGAYYGAFDRTCEILGFDKFKCSEVAWVCKQSDKAIFFYDESQSIKPSDANVEDFLVLKAAKNTQIQTLVSQFRVRGGNSYVEFVDKLLNNGLGKDAVYSSKHYECLLFESIAEFIEAIHEKNRQFGLSRMIAGYSWCWISKNDSSLFDIEIEDKQLKWNSKNDDWINSLNSEHEVGCIHTTQGYDLNYAGIIFGREISYDKELNEIVIRDDKYFDRNGKQSIKNPSELKQFILNIYKTIMLRGIKGTFVYACDDGLREYLAKYIPIKNQKSNNSKNISLVELQPYINAVPLYDLGAGTVNFSYLQNLENKEWCFVPDHVKLNESFFAFRVHGESMNKVIPNDSLCLFRIEQNNNPDGKIVLLEHRDHINDENNSHFTVREFQSVGVNTGNHSNSDQIYLKPISYDNCFKSIVLTRDQLVNYTVVAEFVSVIY